MIIMIIIYLLDICMCCVFRKTVFNQVQHFVHLNLAVALLLGLVAFVSGIETATEYRVRKYD